MQLHCWSRGVQLLYALQLIARLFPSVSADSVTLPCREDQSANKSAEISCSGPLSGLSGPFSTLNHRLQGYQPPAEGALSEGSAVACQQSFGCLDRSSGVTENAFALDPVGCRLLPPVLLPAASKALQTLYCLRPCVTLVAEILQAADENSSSSLRNCSHDNDTVSDYGFSTVCSRLALTGACGSSVLQTSAALLYAVCQHQPAAVLLALPEACKNAGHMLPTPYPDNSSHQTLFNPRNCPPEANTLSCSLSRSLDHRRPRYVCDILCALSGATVRFVTGASVYSNKAVNTASVGRAPIISGIVLGVALVLLLLFLIWKMRGFLLCPCCLPDELNAVEANEPSNAGLSVQPRSTNMPEHAIKKGFDHLPKYIAAKLAGYKQAKQQKQHRGQSRETSPNRGSWGPSVIQMISRSRSPTDRQQKRKRQKGKGRDQWDEATEVDNIMRRSDDSTEALIGVGADQLDLAVMQDDAYRSTAEHQFPGSSTSSVSLSLSEQYSIASCSYPPVEMPDIQQFGNGVLLSAATSADGLEETLAAEDNFV